jgi:hypothetical protein
MWHTSDYFFIIIVHTLWQWLIVFKNRPVNLKVILTKIKDNNRCRLKERYFGHYLKIGVGNISTSTVAWLRFEPTNISQICLKLNKTNANGF